jgi:hypothetical protein
MRETARGLDAPHWLILAGSILFITVLALSAIWEADIRWLHFFQAWMYLAAALLGLRRNKWGYFIGISVAGLWDYINLFVTTFFFAGLHEVSHWVQTGRLARPDLAIAVFAWFSNLAVIIGSCWGYARLKKRSVTDLGFLLLCFILTTGFFALDMALFQPRYLALFPRMLHPHWPW